MKKKILTILVCSLFVSTIATAAVNIQVVQASENPFIVQEGENPDPNDDSYDIAPIWDYTAGVSQGLTISSSGLARGSAYIVSQSNVKRISSYMILQYYNPIDSCYEEVSGASWSKMVGTTVNNMEYEYKVTKRGKYRIKMIHYVYSTDGNSETIISYSGEETY